MILKKFAEQVARQVGVGVARGRERDAAKVVEKMTTMATTATVAKAVEDVAEGVENVAEADRGAGVELAMKAEQQAGEVEGEGVVEEVGEEVGAQGLLHALGQNPKALADQIPRSPCWLTINSASSKIKVLRKTRNCHSEAAPGRIQRGVFRKGWFWLKSCSLSTLG